MAPIEQFFVTLNVATPDLFASFDKRKDRQKFASSYKPVRSNAAERANKLNISNKNTFHGISCITKCISKITNISLVVLVQ